MKAVAIPYVVALILAIVVVVVIGYWFFFIVGPSNTETLTIQCRAKFIAYCTSLTTAGKLTDTEVSKFGVRDLYPECSSVDATKLAIAGKTKAGCQEATGTR